MIVDQSGPRMAERWEEWFRISAGIKSEMGNESWSHPLPKSI